MKKYIYFDKQSKLFPSNYNHTQLAYIFIIRPQIFIFLNTDYNI